MCNRWMNLKLIFKVYWLYWSQKMVCCFVVNDSIVSVIWQNQGYSKIPAKDWHVVREKPHTGYSKHSFCNETQNSSNQDTQVYVIPAYQGIRGQRVCCLQLNEHSSMIELILKYQYLKQKWKQFHMECNY